MKLKKNTHLAALTCVSLLGSAALSQADTLLWNFDSGTTHGWVQLAGNGAYGLATGEPAQSGITFLGDSSGNADGSTNLNILRSPTIQFDLTSGLSAYLKKGHANTALNQTAGVVSGTTTVNGFRGIALFDVVANNYLLTTGKTSNNNNWDLVSWTSAQLIAAGVTISGTYQLHLIDQATGGWGHIQLDTVSFNGTVTEAPAPIISGTWANTAGGTWDTAGNWSGNIVANGSDSTANFNTLNITADTTVDLNSPRTIGNLVFGDTDTSSAAGWTLANNGAPGNTLTLSGTTPTITVNALGDTKTATISTAVFGTSGLTKAGTGSLTLTSAISYSGATTISQGTLLISGQSYFNAGRTTTVASGAVFELNNSNNTFTTLMPASSVTGAGTFRLSGNSTINQSNGGSSGNRLIFAMQSGGLIDLQGTSRLTNGGWQQMNWTDNKADMLIASGATFDVWDGQDVFIDALTGSGTVTKVHNGNSPRLLTVGVDNGSGTFSGTITNATGGHLALVKAGSGTQTLSGTNTYTGNTTVQDGTLSIPSSGSLRFRPTTGGQTNSLTGSATASLSYLGTVNLDLSAAETIDGNFWTLVNVGSFSGPAPTLTPAAVTSTLGAFSETSPGTWELFSIGAKWTFIEDDGSLIYNVTATPYQLWANSFTPVIGLPTEDDDNDGVLNQEEFAFGLLPNSGASVNPIAAPLNRATGTFSYTRRTTSGLTYSVWFSENLVGWTKDTGAVEGTPVPSGDHETVEVTLSALPGNPLPTKLFVQVRAN